MREVYSRRRKVVQDTLQRDLADWLEPIPSFYGMHMAAVAKPNVDVETAAAAVLERGVKIHTFSRYFLGEPDRSGMIFGYGAVELSQISLGLGYLGEAFRT